MLNFNKQVVPDFFQTTITMHEYLDALDSNVTNFKPLRARAGINDTERTRRGHANNGGSRRLVDGEVVETLEESQEFFKSPSSFNSDYRAIKQSGRGVCTRRTDVGVAQSRLRRNVIASSEGTKFDRLFVYEVHQQSFRTRVHVSRLSFMSLRQIHSSNGLFSNPRKKKLKLQLPRVLTALP